MFDFFIPVCCSCTCWTPGSSGNGPMKQGLSSLLSCFQFGCFLGIESLVFSEFWHGIWNPYQVVHDSARFFGKTLFVPKIGEMDLKFRWICSIMKIYVVCCVPAQILSLRKILFLKYSPKCSHPIRLHDFQINHFSRTNGWNSLFYLFIYFFCILIQIHQNQKSI